MNKRMSRAYTNVHLTKKEMQYLVDSDKVRKKVNGVWYCISIGKSQSEITRRKITALYAQIDALTKKIPTKTPVYKPVPRLTAPPQPQAEIYMPLNKGKGLSPVAYQVMANAVKMHQWKILTKHWGIHDQIRIKTHSVSQGVRCACRSVGQKVTVRGTAQGYIITRLS